MRWATCKWSNLKQIWFFVFHILVCNYGVISLGVKGERLDKGQTTQLLRGSHLSWEEEQACVWVIVWDKRCRGNVSGDSGERVSKVRGHIERNSATACSVGQKVRRWVIIMCNWISCLSSIYMYNVQHLLTTALQDTCLLFVKSKQGKWKLSRQTANFKEKSELPWAGFKPIISGFHDQRSNPPSHQAAPQVEIKSRYYKGNAMQLHVSLISRWTRTRYT